MKLMVMWVSLCLAAALLAGSAAAYEKVEPGVIVMSPEDYVGRYVTIDVVFGKVSNRYEPWEEQANLKQDRTIKLIVSPLSEIVCYADKVPDNEKAIGGLRPGQKLVLSGYIKKCRREVKVKGERETVKRTAKGGERYVFMVKKIESVGEAAPPSAERGMGRRRRRGL